MDEKKKALIREILWADATVYANHIPYMKAIALKNRNTKVEMQYALNYSEDYDTMYGKYTINELNLILKSVIDRQPKAVAV